MQICTLRVLCHFEIVDLKAAIVAGCGLEGVVFHFETLGE